MSKKDYIQIAACVSLADFGPPVLTKRPIETATDRRLKLAQTLADCFALDNPRFDRFLFIKTCMASN